jgi:hypothetical protein
MILLYVCCNCDGVRNLEDLKTGNLSRKCIICGYVMRLMGSCPDGCAWPFEEEPVCGMLTQ